MQTMLQNFVGKSDKRQDHRSSQSMLAFTIIALYHYRKEIRPQQLSEGNRNIPFELLKGQRERRNQTLSMTKSAELVCAYLNKPI